MNFPTLETDLCDIDLGLGDFEAYDLRSLRQPSQIKEYDSVDHSDDDNVDGVTVSSDDDDADGIGASSDDDTESDPNYEEGESSEEDETCSWRIHASRLLDEVTW